MTKRVFDLVFASLGLILFSPLFLVLAVAIPLESKGPVFYRGLRVGLNGRPFRIFKFRTMVADADERGPSSTSSDDARITWCGRFIRKFKLDEFPQLLNVIKGDMSLVGPRPQVPWAVDRYTDEEKKILQLRPGITDWASLQFYDEGGIIKQSGIANADEAYWKLIHPEKIRLQLEYLRNHNLSMDVRIIACTLWKPVLHRRKHSCNDGG